MADLDFCLEEERNIPSSEASVDPGFGSKRSRVHPRWIWMTQPGELGRYLQKAQNSD